MQEEVKGKKYSIVDRAKGQAGKKQASKIKVLNREDEKRVEASHVSTKEGCANEVALSIETQLTPFALALNASPFQVGLLSSAAGLIAPISNLLGDRLMESNSRKWVVRTFVYLQALIWIFPLVLAWMFSRGIAPLALPYMLIIGYGFYAAMGGIAYPAWFSWIGDLVAPNERGAYFGKRYRIVGIFGLMTILLSGLLLDFAKTSGVILIGFSLTFLVAFAAKITAFSILRKQYEPRFHLNHKNNISFLEFIRKKGAYSSFAIYHGLFYLVLMVASPFFSVYMLNELGLGYTMYTIVTMSMTVFILIFSPLAGKLIDKYGNLRMFSWACIAFSINPLLWIIIKNPLLLIFIPQALVGFANAVFLVVLAKFTFDETDKQHRAISITYTNILAGIGVAIGAFLGGLLIKYSPNLDINPFVLVFAFSAVGRLAVSLLMIKRMHRSRVEQKREHHFFPLVRTIRLFEAEARMLKQFVVSRKRTFLQNI